MRFSVAMLGTFQATWEGQALAFPTAASRALLAYLAAESQRPHSRELLAALLWPDQTQAAAYANLRQTLARIRKAFPDAADADVLLRVTPQALQFARDGAMIDVLLFDELLANCANHAHAALAACPACIARLDQAVALYQGELLHGLFVEHSESFAEWLLVRRDALHRQALDALNTLTAHAEANAEYTRMRDFAARQLALEPWREQAHVQLMRALAFSGQHGAALAQYETCRRTLEAEFGVEPRAETRALYEQIRAGALTPVSRATATPHNLPAVLTPIVGREAELAEIAATLQQPDMRLLTLVGAGGMGKTRLALELARTQLHNFPDGVFVIALAPLATAAAIVPTIDATLGLNTQGGDARQTLLHALRPKRMLLVLDNYEHLLDGADIVVDILQAAPQVVIIATSRERLSVHGEQQYVVGGLAYAQGAPLADAADAGAVRLFVQSARRVRSGFGVSAANLAAVQKICQLVQGMPLGLELAAAWTESLPPGEIAVEIERSADFLAVEWRDVPERQQSMRAVFDWSWRLLTQAEQQVFRQLTVFRGGFTRDAAQTVAGASLRVLTGLVRKALLRPGAGNDPGGRYEMHQLLRQFAAEQLSSAAGEREQVEARHADYYLALAEEAAPRFATAEQVEVMNRIESEHDNVRAALAWAQQHGDIVLGLRLTGALWPFWQRRCHLIEGRRWLESFLMEEDMGAAAPELRAAALAGAGWLAHDQDDFARAEALFSMSLQLERSLGHNGRVAAVLAHRAVMARGQGQYDEALALVEESLALARAAGDRAGVAYALFRLGLITREQGERERAAAVYRECLAAYRALGDRSGASFALLGLGDIARDQGDPAQVEAFCAASLAEDRELGQHWGIGFSLNNLALAALMRGELHRAMTLADEALALFRAHGIRGGVVELLITLAQIACALEDYDRARLLLREGLEQGWPAGPCWLIVTGLEELARIQVASGDLTQAARLCAAASAWRSTMGVPLPPYRRAVYATTLAAAQIELGEASFVEAWAAGAAWHPAQAIDVASMLTLH